MNDPSSAGAEGARSYLLQMLKFEPRTEADQILKLRADYLNFPSETIGFTREGGLEDRGDLIQRIQDLRDNFWTWTPARLQNCFESIDASDFPDVAAAFNRLQRIAALRSEFQSLELEHNYDEGLAEAIRDALVQGPREAAERRHRFQQSLDSHEKRQAVRRMVKLLRTKAPGVYRIEEGWLKGLLLKPVKSPAKGDRSRGCFVTIFASAWYIGIACAVISLIVRFMKL